MTFEEAWALDVGAVVFVSDGRPQPPGGLGQRRYNEWRSHNFGGEILAKLGEAPARVLRISDLGHPQNVAFDVSETTPHTFTLAP